MADIKQVMLPDGTTYDLRDDSKSAVSWTQNTSSGTNIASITIDGTTTQVYAPTSGGGTVGSNVFYGTCSTAASTAAKEVVCSEFTSAHLTAGTVLHVKFSKALTTTTPTLNVNSTGAVSIARVGTTTGTMTYYWSAGEVVGFVHDGTRWVMMEGALATTTYYGMTKLSSSTSSTSTSLAATPSAVKAAYDLADSKQDTLTAGTNITISGTTISSPSYSDIIDHVRQDYLDDALAEKVSDVTVGGTSVVSGQVATLGNVAGLTYTVISTF